MSSGLSVPVSVDKLGKARVTSGSDQLRKLLMVAIQPCPSDNPFQDLGLDEKLIFSVNSPPLQGKLRLAIDRIFATFQRQGRAKLRSIKYSTDSNRQEMKVFLSYQELETTEDKEIALILPLTGDVRPRVDNTGR